MKNGSCSMNLVEKANKVMSFRKAIRALFSRNGMEYPSDEKISAYINSGGKMNVSDFVNAYNNHDGVFREPIDDFMAEIDKFDWADGRKPTIEQVREWINRNESYDVSLFLRERTINSYEGFYRQTLLNALKLKDETLVKLWNDFLEESHCYGDDCNILDLTNEYDCNWLTLNRSQEELYYICHLVTSDNIRYIQVFSHDGEPEEIINPISDVKGFIVSYWCDIVDRVMHFMDVYYDFDESVEDEEQRIVQNVFIPVILKKCNVKDLV